MKKNSSKTKTSGTKKVRPLLSLKNYYVIGEVLSTHIGQVTVGKNYYLFTSGTAMEKHSIDKVISGL